MKSSFLLASAFAVLTFLAAPLTAQASADFNCDEHAAHIDKEIGSEKALEAYHVLHGDKADDAHVVETLKAEHPDVEHELEEYVAKGCTEAELEAHAHDSENH